MPPDQPTPASVRILLVEDDLDQAHLLKFLLENEGDYSVTLAQDGVRGSSLVQDREWDLIITDLNLPGADGMAVLDAARTHRPGTPVMATTGYSGPEYADRARERGAHDVLLKPLDRDDLLARVEALLAGPLPGVGTLHPSPQEPTEAPSPEPPPTAEPTPEPTPTPEPASEPEPPPEAAPESASEPEASPRRILAISIRPGDAEAGCGGTLLRHRIAGDQVVLLTLTHGTPGQAGKDRGEQAKQAGKRMGVRFFVGNAGSGDDPMASDLERLVGGAMKEIRPHVVYVPTPHHPEPSFQVVHDTAVRQGEGLEGILAYDPGDSEPGFVPDLFVPVDEVLDTKARVIEAFDASDAPYLAADQILISNRFWARHTKGRPAEALVRVRGEPSLFSDPPFAH